MGINGLEIEIDFAEDKVFWKNENNAGIELKLPYSK